MRQSAMRQRHGFRAQSCQFCEAQAGILLELKTVGVELAITGSNSQAYRLCLQADAAPILLDRKIDNSY